MRLLHICHYIPGATNSQGLYGANIHAASSSSGHPVRNAPSSSFAKNGHGRIIILITYVVVLLITTAAVAAKRKG